MKLPEFLTVAEAANLMRVTPTTIYAWLRAGILEKHQVHSKGGKVLIRSRDITKALDRKDIVTLPDDEEEIE